MTAKKKVITLDSDKLHSMLFDVEWDLAEKTQELIKVLKETNSSLEWFKDQKPLIKALENLLDKRMNVLSSQLLIDDLEDLEIYHGIEKDLEISKEHPHNIVRDSP